MSSDPNGYIMNSAVFYFVGLFFPGIYIGCEHVVHGSFCNYDIYNLYLAPLIVNSVFILGPVIECVLLITSSCAHVAIGISGAATATQQ